MRGVRRRRCCSTPRCPSLWRRPPFPSTPTWRSTRRWWRSPVNRNGDYSMEEKQKIMDILAKVGSLDSDVDDSPKSEFKERKNL